ncbi:MAG: hypothetical protein Greene041619_868 [Candidatus Peregrinibacteria bacterium Greene0416_19]|nr:MAG: hypothetical protein Greene041619_868 [Candidatus Peregrinibacteria bacterium Greene0416_19]
MGTADVLAILVIAGMNIWLFLLLRQRLRVKHRMVGEQGCTAEGRTPLEQEARLQGLCMELSRYWADRERETGLTHAQLRAQDRANLRRTAEELADCLDPSELQAVFEGREKDLPPDRMAHFESCGHCQSTIRACKEG